MPDPIQPVQGLCSNVQTLDNYRRQINLSLQLTLDAINEELGTTFTLPGLPPLPVQGLPELVVPGRAGWDRDLQIRKPVPPAGFIGNRFGIRAGGKSADAKLRIGELPGFSIGGTGGLVVSGTDPSTFLIQWINTNYQILAQQLATENVEWTPIQVPYTELCESGGGIEEGGTGPVSPGQLLVNDMILLNNQGAEGAALTACSPTLSAGLPAIGTGGSTPAVEWFRDKSPTPTAVYGPGGFFETNLGFAGGSTIFWSRVNNYHVSGGGGPEVDFDPTRQPIACGNGFTVSYNWSISQVGIGSVASVTLGTEIRAISIDSLSSFVQGETHGGTITGPHSISGSHTFTVLDGTLAATAAVGFKIDHGIHHMGGSATYVVQVSNLVLAPL